MTDPLQLAGALGMDVSRPPAAGGGRPLDRGFRAAFEEARERIARHAGRSEPPSPVDDAAPDDPAGENGELQAGHRPQGIGDPSLSWIAVPVVEAMTPDSAVPSGAPAAAQMEPVIASEGQPDLSQGAALAEGASQPSPEGARPQPALAHGGMEPEASRSGTAADGRPQERAQPPAPSGERSPAIAGRPGADRSSASVAPSRAHAAQVQAAGGGAAPGPGEAIEGPGAPPAGDDAPADAVRSLVSRAAPVRSQTGGRAAATRRAAQAEAARASVNTTPSGSADEASGGESVRRLVEGLAQDSETPEADAALFERSHDPGQGVAKNQLQARAGGPAMPDRTDGNAPQTLQASGGGTAGGYEGVKPPVEPPAEPVAAFDEGAAERGAPVRQADAGESSSSPVQRTPRPEAAGWSGPERGAAARLSVKEEHAAPSAAADPGVERPVLARPQGASGGVEGRFAQLTREALEQIVKGVDAEFGPEGSTLRFQLAPGRLGDLDLRLDIRNGAVSAQFTTATPEVKALIESALPDLRQHLSEQGVNVQELSVSVGGREEPSNGNGRPGEAGGRAPRRVRAAAPVEAAGRAMDRMIPSASLVDVRV